MTKECNEHFKTCIKCKMCDNDHIDKDVKIRGHCHITGKYRGSALRDGNISPELNYKTHIVFHNLKNYYSLLIIQELGKFNLKINDMPNGLKN